MPPELQTATEIALRSLLTEIDSKKAALEETSEKACTLDSDELEEIVQRCIATDAVLTVAQATILASLNARPAVQS